MQQTTVTIMMFHLPFNSHKMIPRMKDKYISSFIILICGAINGFLLTYWMMFKSGLIIISHGEMAISQSNMR